MCKFNELFMVGVMSVLLLLTGASCQDHHFVPYDKMEPPPDPGSSSSKKTGPPMVKTSPPVRDTGGFVGKIVSGRVDVAEAVKSKASNDWVLYIIVRPAGGGAPVAVSKTVKVRFPLDFTIDEKDIMMSAPKPGMKIAVEARFDSDGDAMTKGAADLYGESSGEIDLGAGGIVITLNERTG